MAFLINEDCISCGACEDVCPNNAISEGEDIFLIDGVKCTECDGTDFAGDPQCIANCPVDCILKKA